MSLRLIRDRAHFKRVTAVATVLALAGGAAEIPLGPVGSVAHAQVAPIPQDGVRFGQVRNDRGTWRAEIFFDKTMVVSTVAHDFVPPETNPENPRDVQVAEIGDPVFDIIPQSSTFTVEHYEQVNRRQQLKDTYEVVVTTSISKSTSGHNAIRLSYELPDVVVKQHDRLSLAAPGKGSVYPMPLDGGSSRYSMPYLNTEYLGHVRVHNPDSKPVGKPKVLVTKDGATTEPELGADNSFPVALGTTVGEYTIEVVPPEGFATPAKKTIDVASGAVDRDFDVYPITVSGTLLDASETPVQGATVAIAGRTDTTDQNGKFTVVKVPAGTHDVFIGETTTTKARTVRGVVVSDQRGNTIELPRIDTKPQFGDVSGRVFDPDGNGVADVKVTAGGKTSTTGADGMYSIVDVPTGETTIEVIAAPSKYVRPTPRKENVTVSGVSDVDFPLELKPTPTPKPSTTTPKPRPTTSKPTTTAPKPTTAKPKPSTTTTTPKPAPTVGSVAGKVTDPAGTAVPGATVTARDANGETFAVRVAKDGTFRLNNLPPGSYTVAVDVPTGHVAPPPADAKVKAGQIVRLPGFVVKPEKPKARFDWDRLVVKPGETQVIAPKRSGDTTFVPSFRTTGVTQVSPDGTTTQLPAEDRWISVEKDGTVVARPPRDAAPGEYRVKAKDAAGQTHTITVEVAQPVPMAKQHEVRFPLIPVPAGATRQAGRPRATVTDGPFVYQDRRVPEGARFDVDPAFASWVRADDNGRLTFTPPRDAKPGIRTIPVKVTFPDNSFRTYNAEVEVGDPLFARTTDLGYEDGLSVQPGHGLTVLRTGASVLPEGTTFEVDRSEPLDGWVALVNETSGDLRLFAPKQGGDVQVPVIAYFADGSSTKLTASVRLSTSSALSTKHSPSYADGSAAPGETATVGLRGTVPAGTTFVVVDGGGLGNVGVDTRNGSLKIQLPPDAPRDTPYTVTVRVRYADGSTEEITSRVTAVSDAARFTPQNSGSTSVRTGLPRGAKLADFDHAGWDVAYDSATGELTATPDSSVPAGTVLKVPVKATFPDGSTKIVEYPLTAAAPPETKPQQGSSESAGWIAVVLGALAAIAGIGYAVFLNQDAVRAQLKQFGF
ncbi:Rib/alpha-like domain-containing protein [Corynebacterium pilbarense]